MKTFYCSACRPIKAESISQAANVFALRLARRKYGRRATAIRFPSCAYAWDWSLAEYSAFIGIASPESKEIKGESIHFTVTL